MKRKEYEKTFKSAKKINAILPEISHGENAKF